MQTLNKKEVLDLIRHLKAQNQIELRDTSENDKLLKVVITGDFTLITLCTVRKTVRKIREMADFELLYCSSEKYKLTTEEYVFSVNKYYDKVAFYKIPKEFFPEYHL